ncbi:hypothetical protein A5733_02125 [Mycobacterium sp. NS-7484]|nr:hypothetical protein A5733_02125 [Mycobacterium sp. NS-7484]
MGEVYLADHPRLSRQDAIKVLSSQLSEDSEFIERFRREADLSASLWHPYIVGVHDRGECDNRLWLSMDYVEGTDAARLLADSPGGLPVSEVADIVDAIAVALDFAHDRGLLHRDVKPANILLTTDGDRRILLADFGIGREIGTTNGLTATGLTIGTVSYAAPEQLMGDDLDGRADQYALAATAYHLLSGHPVFEHSNPTIVISRHLNATPGRLVDQRAEFAFLDPVLQQALAKVPDERYPSCTLFAQALRAAVTAIEQPSPTTPTEAPSPSAVTQHASVAGVLREAAAPTRSATTPAKTTASAPTDTSAKANPTSTNPTVPEGLSRSLLLAVVGAVIVAVAAVAVAVTIGIMGSPAGPRQAAGSSPTSSPDATPRLPLAPAATPLPSVPAPPPHTTPTAPPAPKIVSVPTSNGSAGVITRSGKTACQIMTAFVGCQVNWEVATPLMYGSPANGVRIHANGQWEWASGDMGTTASFTTLAYGTTYTTLGWTIEPSSTGTRFTNNLTGHGIVVSTDGINPF